MLISNYVEYITACSNLTMWNNTYREGIATVSDDVYDSVRRAVQKWEEAHPENKLTDSPTEHVGSIVVEENKIGDNKHSSKMYSLENALDAEEAKIWIDRWQLGRDETLVIIGEFKYNGLATSATYIDGQLRKVLTRGDGEYGVDITEIAELYMAETIDATGLVEIRGETILPKEAYQDFFSEYANPLSAAVGVIGSKGATRSLARHLVFIPYDIITKDYQFDYHSEKLDLLRSFGIYGLTYFRGPAETIVELFASITERRDTITNYEIDGMVFKINSLAIQKELGYTNHHPLHSFAYKFPPLIKPCVIKEVVFQVGMSGVITPVAKITPTKLFGTTVTSVILHNEERMRNLKIAVGNSYEVFKAGDVIPSLGKLLSEVPTPIYTEFPTNCPCCSAHLVKEGAHYFCKNAQCKDQLVASIAYAVSREVLNIKGLAEKTISLLIDAGLVKSTADIFRLDTDEVAKLEGFTYHSAYKLNTAIQNARYTGFDKYIAALGIPDIGIVTSRRVADQLPVREVLFSLNIPDRVLELKIPSVKHALASNIANYFSSPEKLAAAKDLASVLALKHNPTSIEVNPVSSVTGKSFVFTGSFSVPKEVLKNKVLVAGGILREDVSGRVDYLVVGDKPGDKLRKAELLQIDVIDERTFLSLFEEAESEEEDCQKEFATTANNTLLGYHVEGGETFENGGSTHLSLATLHDARPLFICADKSRWWSDHLPEAHLRLYEIEFEKPTQKVFTDETEYDLLLQWNEEKKVYVYSSKLLRLVSEGYSLFTLKTNTELPESFLINPTKYVKDIKRLK